MKFCTRVEDQDLRYWANFEKNSMNIFREKCKQRPKMAKNRPFSTLDAPGHLVMQLLPLIPIESSKLTPWLYV